MSSDAKLLAWIEPQEGGDYIASFVAAAAARPPATQPCASPDQGRQWVEGQARSFGVPVEWITAQALPLSGPRG